MSITGASTNVSTFLNQIVAKVDANHDGVISTNELGSFLNVLLSGLGASANTATAAATPQPDTTTVAPTTFASFAGFDGGRMNSVQDQSPKYVFGRWAYERTNGGTRPLTGDDVRAFVAQDPRWEIDPNSSADDPHIRVKQDELDKWTAGKTTVYQDVIQDSGPGGAGNIIFLNAE